MTIRLKRTLIFIYRSGWGLFAIGRLMRVLYVHRSSSSVWMLKTLVLRIVGVVIVVIRWVEIEHLIDFPLRLWRVLLAQVRCYHRRLIGYFFGMSRGWHSLILSDSIECLILQWTQLHSIDSWSCSLFLGWLLFRKNVRPNGFIESITSGRLISTLRFVLLELDRVMQTVQAKCLSIIEVIRAHSTQRPKASG